ncbi:hypothetical protein [Urechidicola sp. KH5]
MRIKPICFAICILISLGTFAQKDDTKVKRFKDTLDGAFDASEFLINHNGVLPIVSPITEPAVGYGGVLAGVYFVTKEDPRDRPDLIIGAAGITSNGTWLAGGGYIGFWKKDSQRYQGFAGYADANLEYYGFGNNKAFDFEINSFFFMQKILFRINGSPFFIGGKYQLTKTNVPIFEGNNIIDPIDFDLWNSGVSLITEFDNLNNFMSPNAGTKIHLSYDQNLQFLGSDRNWGTINFHTHHYKTVNEKWMAAFRLESNWATGNIPFYAQPFVDLRGVPALRYQGSATALFETEHHYNLNNRWSVLAFAGGGTAFESYDNFNADEFVWNAGGGFRYLIARIFGLRLGVDVARGPEEWAFYVTAGTSWR